MKSVIIDVILILFKKTDAEGSDFQETEVVELLGHVIQSEKEIIQKYSKTSGGMHNLPRQYTTYIIEKLLLLMCKYSEKFQEDLFLLLSMEKDENGKQN